MLAVSFKTKSFKNVMPLAIEAYEKNNNDPKLIEGLARVNFYLGNRQDSLKLFKILYKMLPDKKEGRLPFISSLNYTSGITQEEYMKECLNYNSILEKKYNIENNKNQFNWNKSDKINLAFLSADFKTHSVSHFLIDILKKIDNSKFNIYLISNLKTVDQDNVSQDLKKLVFKWVDAYDFSDDDLTFYLRSLKLDFLIDLSGFTNGNRFEVLIRRCAKVQIEWLGYNNSLGAMNIDYLISDKNLIKSNETNLYKEDVLFMPNIWNALSAPEKLPEITDKSNEKNSDFVFCSFNNFQKISDRTIDVWSKILNTTKSKLLLKNSLIGGEDLKNNVLDKFISKGLQKDQIIFLEREKNIYDHLKLYNKANVALDTFPYPGVTTSYEAMLMGLPVLTMQGFNFNSRCGESINKNVIMDNLIAKDDHDYLNIAISLTKDLKLNEKYGENLRKKALSSPLFNTDQFTRDFEELITKVYNKN
jgi:predicted O-linked N-acetylglucosamine transferase (SPINDLY family)